MSLSTRLSNDRLRHRYAALHNSSDQLEQKLIDMTAAKDKALEALKETQALYRVLVSAHELRGRSKTGVFEDALDTRSDANVKLIAELEEVR